MCDAATQLLATFDSLAPLEQHELLKEMLKRSGELPGSMLTDVQLAGIADELFQALDAKESDDAQSDKK